MEIIAESVLDISTVSVEDGSTTINFEGMVGKYGRVYASHTYIGNSASKDSGKWFGEARTVTEEGDMIAASLQGVFRRSGSKIKVLSLDDATNGDQNYVTLEVDLLSKQAKVVVYDAWS